MFEETKAIARKLYDECFTKGNLKAVEELVSTNCRIHDPVFPSLGPGPENLRQHIQMCRTAFPDLRFTIEDIIAENDEVVIHWTGHGTQKGQFLGVAPTDKTARVSGTSISKIKNGKIVEQWVDWNLLTLLEQLGAATPLKAAMTVR